jgi:hypothetical protein
MAKEVPAFLRAEIGNDATDPTQSRRIVCSAALRGCALVAFPSELHALKIDLFLRQ